jgi:hypothetical protein
MYPRSHPAIARALEHERAAVRAAAMAPSSRAPSTGPPHDDRQPPTRRLRRFALGVLISVACALAAIAAVASPSPAQETSGATIVYSDIYLKLIAAFPSGYADECDISAVLNGGGGVCDARIDVVYFYPDGTLGGVPWFADPSSPRGWSIEADPCEGLTDDDYALWSAYVDYVDGYVDTAPDLTDEQVDRYAACWGYWF